MNLSLSHNKEIKLYTTIFALMVFSGFLFFGNAEKSYAAGFCLCTANASTGHYTGALLSSTKNDYTDSECSDGCKGHGYTTGINNFTQDSKGYATVDAPIKACFCSPKSGETKWTAANVSKTYTDETCNKECVDTGYPSGTLTNDPSMLAKTIGPGLNIPANEVGKTVKNLGGVDVCDANSSISGVFKCLLLGIFGLVKLLLEMAATIFRWVVDVKNFNYVVDNKAIIYPIWQNVRDLLNIAFILVLLYSAFCTILQIEKYSYKKLLFNLIIMALLVNFSFPITRFIIDISNVLMYTLIKTLLGDNAGNSLAVISSQSGILPTFTASSSTFLGIITAIVFGFILAITLLAIGILLVIRIVALAILIIFSPLAFVSTILPDVSNYSSKWWDNLFRYSFFGPIMIFVIYIATQVLKNMGETQGALTQLAGKESIDPGIAGSLAYFAIPIVLLWMGMGIAQSMSIAGAGAVMGGAQKVAKWAGKAPFKASWWGMKKAASATGYPGGIKQKWDSWKDKLNANQKSKEAQVAARLGVTGATVKDAETRAAEHEKNHESDASLIIKTEAGDAGAALALIKRGKMDDKIYGNFVSHNKDASLKEHVAKKVKKNRVDILVDHKQKDDAEKQKAAEAISKATKKPIGSITPTEIHKYIEEEEYGNLNPEDIKTQYWNVIIGKAGTGAKQAIEKMFDGLADEAKGDIGKAMSKNNRASVNSLRSGGFI